MRCTIKGTITEVLDRKLDYHVTYQPDSGGSCVLVIDKEEARNAAMIDDAGGRAIKVWSEGSFITRADIAGRRVLDRGARRVL